MAAMNAELLYSSSLLAEVRQLIATAEAIVYTLCAQFSWSRSYLNERAVKQGMMAASTSRTVPVNLFGTPFGLPFWLLVVPCSIAVFSVVFSSCQYL
jgi:hypothetical protein